VIDLEAKPVPQSHARRGRFRFQPSLVRPRDEDDQRLADAQLRIA
jgi:hypothetical protein